MINIQLYDNHLRRARYRNNNSSLSSTISTDRIKIAQAVASTVIMEIDPSHVAIGNPASYCGLLNDISNDPSVQALRAAPPGGGAATSFFTAVDIYAQMLAGLAGTTDLDGWNSVDMDNGTTGYYLEKWDGTNDYAVSLSFTNCTIVDGNIQPNDTKVIHGGVTYNGVGNIISAFIYNDTPLNTCLWDVGVAIAGDLVWDALKSITQNIVDKAATNVVSSMGRLVKLETGGMSIEEFANEEEAANAAGMEELGIAVDVGATAGTIGIIGFLVICAALFIVLSIVLHYSYQRVRIWNLTSYSINWTTYFDEGSIEGGPDSSQPFQPVCLRSSPIPGSKSVHQAYYYDFDISSDNESNGIGWAMQAQFVDPTNNQVMYTCTFMFDIPLVGENSTSVTFNPQSDLQAYYNSQEGVNKSISVQAQSSDNALQATTTYDFLSGQHPIPTLTGATTTGYFYQSVVAFIETDIATKTLPACPIKTSSHSLSSPLGSKGIRMWS